MASRKRGIKAQSEIEGRKTNLDSGSFTPEFLNYGGKSFRVNTAFAERDEDGECLAVEAGVEDARDLVDDWTTLTKQVCSVVSTWNVRNTLASRGRTKHGLRMTPHNPQVTH